LLAKVDLHRHLEGSVRIGTLIEIASQYGIGLPASGLDRLVRIQPNDARTHTVFLAKFQTLRQFYRSPEVIMRITREAVEDAAQDGVEYLELRFTPAALGRQEGFPAGEVMDWVAASARQAAAGRGIEVRLIVSVNRHEPVKLAEEVAALAAERAGDGIVGLDLAGNEAEYPALPFAGVLREARASGLHLTVHAGEWGGADSVREAVEVLGAERIGHGVRVLEDPAAAGLVRERQIPLEVCVTSNVQSGAAPSLAEHPLPKLAAAGLNVTINTDDPAISGITLSDEYRLAVEVLGLSPGALRERILAAARAAFLPEAERAALIERIRRRLGPG